MQVTVRDVMSPAPVAVPAGCTIDEVLRALVSQGLPAIYVTTGDDRLAGVVTDYELLKHEVLGGDSTLSAETVMSRNVPTVQPDESALAVCSQFREARCARMAVVDAQGRLIGTVNRVDLMRMMLALRGRPGEAADAALERCDAPSTLGGPRSLQAARKAVTVDCTG
jgi:CBS-domain-containing membrane protein